MIVASRLMNRIDGWKSSSINPSIVLQVLRDTKQKTRYRAPFRSLGETRNNQSAVKAIGNDVEHEKADVANG